MVEDAGVRRQAVYVIERCDAAEVPVYVDFRNDWPRPEPWKPKRPKKVLTKREERVVVWFIAFNLLMLLLAPLAGNTILDAVIALLRH